MVNIRISHVRLTGYALLLLNIIIFLAGWLRWYVAIPAICILSYGFYKLIQDLVNDKSQFSISKKSLWLMVGLMTSWVLLSGIGGVFPQKPDLHWRNAILHDLINYSWPVVYPDGSSLTYYIAFWLAPALLGKLTALLFNQQVVWIVANVVYALYCVCILSIVLILAVNYLEAKSALRILAVASVLILFSGIDIVPTILQQFGQSNICIGMHLEWWTNFQYSSNSTQLAWVYNQAVPAWLVTMLFLLEKRMNHWAYLGLLLLPYGPFPFIGLFFIMIVTALDELIISVRISQINSFFCEVFTIPNITSALVILPIYLLYYSTNNATAQGGLVLQYSESYVPFIIVEYLIYVFLIACSLLKERLFRLTTLGLLFIPLLSIGGGQDFCMRASIPLLFILMIFILQYVFSTTNRINSKKYAFTGCSLMLMVCLFLGAITPLTEYRASYAIIVQSGKKSTVMMADDIKSLENSTDPIRNCFVTLNGYDSLFNRYLAAD